MKKSLFLATARLRLFGWALGLAGGLLALSEPAQAQVSNLDPTLNNPAAPVMVRPDTATVRKVTRKEKRAQAAADSAKRTERLFGFRVTRPEKAGFLALAPGAGQIYNRKYWKLPLVYGMMGGLGYFIYYEQSRFSQYSKAYRITSVSTMTPAVLLNADEFPDASKELSSANIYTGVVFFRRYRDLAILLTALGYSLQILDAVVDAHLHDFDVSDNLSLNVQPAFLPVPGQLMPATGFSLALRVK